MNFQLIACSPKSKETPEAMAGEKCFESGVAVASRSCVIKALHNGGRSIRGDRVNASRHLTPVEWNQPFFKSGVARAK